MSKFTPPSSYKVAVINEVGKPFEIEERKWQEPAPGMVAVKVLACGVCHSDDIVVQAQVSSLSGDQCVSVQPTWHDS